MNHTLRRTLPALLAVVALSLPTSNAFAGSKDPTPKDHFVAPGDQIIPQVATGGAFAMAFQFMNMSSVAASFQLSFFDGAGNPMSLPFTLDGTENPGGTFIGGRVAARGISFAMTSGTDVQVGYARITSTPPDSIAVSASFVQTIPGRPQFTASVPLSTALHDRFFVPVFNEGPFTASLAIVSLITQTVTFTARNPDGTVPNNTSGAPCVFERAFAAGQHFQAIPTLPTTNPLGLGFDCLDGRNAVIEISGTDIGLAGVGITAVDSGAFITQPIFGPVP